LNVTSADEDDVVETDVVTALSGWSCCAGLFHVEMNITIIKKPKVMNTPLKTGMLSMNQEIPRIRKIVNSIRQ
jgi:hypothetical protein